MSDRRFGITTTNIHGIGGIVVNDITIDHKTETAEARNSVGKIIDLVTYSLEDQITINGLYERRLVKPGSVISVNDTSYIVTNSTLTEENTTFQTASLIALNFQQFVPPVEPIPLTFKSISIGGTQVISLLFNGAPPAPIELMYSKNEGAWTSYTIGDQITLNKDDTVAFSGANDHFSNSDNSYYYFKLTGAFEVDGNIQSLMNWSDTCTNYCYYRLFYNCPQIRKAPNLFATTLAARCYSEMFRNCTSLTAAPQLPATILKNYCYTGMFYDCISLTSAPQLPATQLALNCYSEMFRNCTSLTAAPQLPATILKNYCYTGMFYDCISLTSAPQLPATILKNYCYSDMFRNCTSLTAAPQLPATELALGCYYGMFKNCSNITSVPSALPAISLTQYCYMQMFEGCTSLTDAPIISGISDRDLGSRNCQEMFKNCSSLSSINVAFTGWEGYDDTKNWVKGVAEQGIFKKPYALQELYSDSEIPSGWTVEINDQDFLYPLSIKAVNGDATIQVPFYGNWGDGKIYYRYEDGIADPDWHIANIQIPLSSGDAVYLSGNSSRLNAVNKWGSFAITGQVEASGNIMSLIRYKHNVPQYCFLQLFKDCSGLITAPQLPATTIDIYSYYSMFSGCVNLTAAPDLPATTLAQKCYWNMFRGCSSLLIAPDLPATRTVEQCYYGMFYNCSKLSSINVAFTDWNRINDITENWVSGVADYGIFYKPEALSAEYGESRIPSGWTVIDKEQLVTPLTFKAVGGGVGLELQKFGSPNAITLNVSKNNGQWEEYNVGDSFILNQNETVAFSGANDHFSNSSSNYYYFVIYGNVEATGNIQSLMNWSDTCTNWSYTSLFKNCSSLLTAPYLGAKTLGNSCYYQMFFGCSSISSAPALPVTSLKQSCYYQMFANCSSLITPPALPASTMQIACYDGMFAGCTSLTAAPQLPAKTLAINCYHAMFQYCTSISTCPQLPANSLQSDCYSYMFRGCTSITDAPILTGTTLQSQSYRNMFEGCSNLSSISVNFTNWNSSLNATTNWVSGVASSGIFTKPEDLAEEYGDSRIPYNWTIQQFTTPEPEEPPPSEQV